MRFRTKILLIFTVFALLVSALTSIFTLHFKKLLEKEVEDNQRNIANVIHLSAQRLLSENVDDQRVLKQIIEEIKGIDAVREVTIIDRNQNVVASTKVTFVGQYHPLSSMKLEINKKLEDQKKIVEYRLFEIAIPVMHKQEMIGIVRTTMSLKDFHHPLRLLYFKNLFITLGILILAFWVSFFMLNRLNRPLSQLTAAVKKISAGDLSVSVPCTTKDEIGRLAESFNQTTQKLAEQKQLEIRVHQLERQAIVAELSSSLTHEIRNPLNLIMLTASHLGNQFLPEDQEQCQKYKEYIASLKAEVKHLNQMVGNFLSMGKFSEIIKVRFNLSELIERIRVLVKLQLISKKTDLYIAKDNDIELFADEEQLQLVFLNLILNAIDAVPLEGKIEIQAHKNMNSKEDMVSVIDNGFGLKKDTINRLFEPYFSDKQSGIGIGLAVVKRIIEEHDGHISARNTVSGGARFDLVLPWEEV